MRSAGSTRRPTSQWSSFRAGRCATFLVGRTAADSSLPHGRGPNRRRPHACAHEAGIVHRDLKPENVMVNREGVREDLGLRPHKTGLGSGIGHLAARDRRHADLGPDSCWGPLVICLPNRRAGNPSTPVLISSPWGRFCTEIATARAPFSRTTAAETLAAVIREEPEPLQSLRPAFPLAGAMGNRAMPRPRMRRSGTPRHRELERNLAHPGRSRLPKLLRAFPP